MTNPFGVCMRVFDDLDPSAAPATGIVPLIQDVYHLLITERGTLPTDPEFGFGLSDLTLSGFSPDDLPSLADQIETTLSEDDRIATASVTLETSGSSVAIRVIVTTATEPPTGFNLVGTIGNLKAEILTDTARLLNG